MAPINDNLIDAIELTGSSGTVSGTFVDATEEGNEDPIYWDWGTEETVWYKYTPAADKFFEIGIIDSTTPVEFPVLGIYKDVSGTSWEEVISDDSYDGPGDWLVHHSYVQLESGTTYYIGLGNYESEDTGTFQFYWEAVDLPGPPPYDDIDDALELSTSPGNHTVDFDITFSTYETNEEDEGNGEPGVWGYFDLSSFSGIVELNYDISRFAGPVHPYFTVYAVIDNSFDPASPDFSKLNYLDGNGHNIQVEGSILIDSDYSTNGIYYVAFLDYFYQQTPGVIRFTYSFPIPPDGEDNETCATAKTISGASGITAVHDLRGVTGWESDDPLFAELGFGGGAPLWWKWTNTYGREVILRVNYTQPDPPTPGVNLNQANLGIFHGTCGSFTVGAVDSALSWDVTIQATVADGETVYIEVDGYSADTNDPPTLEYYNRGRFRLQWQVRELEYYDTANTPWPTVIGEADETWGREFTPEAGTVDADWYPHLDGNVLVTASPSTDTSPFNVSVDTTVGTLLPRGPNGNVWSVQTLYPPKHGSSPGMMDYTFFHPLSRPRILVAKQLIDDEWTDVGSSPGQEWDLNQEWIPTVAGAIRVPHSAVGADWKYPSGNYEMGTEPDYNGTSPGRAATDGEDVFVYTFRLQGYFDTEYEGIIYEDDITGQTGAVGHLQVWKTDGGAWTQVGDEIAGDMVVPPSTLTWSYNPFQLNGQDVHGYGAFARIFASPYDPGHPVLWAQRQDKTYDINVDPSHPLIAWQFDGTDWVELDLGLGYDPNDIWPNPDFPDPPQYWFGAVGGHPMFARWTRDGDLITFTQERSAVTYDNLPYGDIIVKNHTTNDVHTLVNSGLILGFGGLSATVALNRVSNVSHSGEEYFLFSVSTYETYVYPMYKYYPATGEFELVANINTINYGVSTFLNDPDPESEDNHWWFSVAGLNNIDGACDRGIVLVEPYSELQGEDTFLITTAEFEDHTTRTDFVAGAGSRKIWLGSLCRNCGSCEINVIDPSLGGPLSLDRVCYRACCGAPI